METETLPILGMVLHPLLWVCTLQYPMYVVLNHLLRQRSGAINFKKHQTIPSAIAPWMLHGCSMDIIYFKHTLWLFNIAMENNPFIHLSFIVAAPIESDDVAWLCEKNKG